MAKEIVNLELGTSPFDYKLTARQGDHGYSPFLIQVIENGDPFDLTGYTISFEAVNSLGQFVSAPVDVKLEDNDKIPSTFQLIWNSTITSIDGIFTDAYFVLHKDDVRYASASIGLEIKKAVDYTEEQAVQYIQRAQAFDQIIAHAQADADSLNNSLSDVNNILERIDDATNNSLGATEEADLAALNADITKTATELVRQQTIAKNNETQALNNSLASLLSSSSGSVAQMTSQLANIATLLEGSDVYTKEEVLELLSEELLSRHGEWEYQIHGIYIDKRTGTVTRTNDSYKTVDGEQVPFVAYPGVDGEMPQNDFDPYMRNIMGDKYFDPATGYEYVKMNRFYYQTQGNDDFLIKRISLHPYPGFKLSPLFINKATGKKLPYILISKYKGSVANNKLESLVGKGAANWQTIVTFRSQALANNAVSAGHQLYDVHTHNLITLLFQIEFAALNSQNVKSASNKTIMKGLQSSRWSNTDLAVVDEETEVNRIIVPQALKATYFVGQTVFIVTSQAANAASMKTITKIEQHDSTNIAIYWELKPGLPENTSMLVTTTHRITGGFWKNGFSNGIAATSGTISVGKFIGTEVGSSTDTATNVQRISDTGVTPVMYRGIESPYGDMWQFVDGLNTNDNVSYVNDNPQTYVSNMFTSDYKPLGYTNSTVNGFVKTMGRDPKNELVELPIAVGASDSTFYGDYYYQNTGQRIAIVGGTWDAGSAVGLVCWSLSVASSSSDVSVGGRLVKRPL